jgi:exosortase
VVGISFYAVFLVGGWTAMRYFAFPICFILVAVQWPYRIEHAMIQGLMRLVANLTVEIIGWFGIPAVQRGNLIEVTTGVVGVDEACSGIRSFQSTLMAGLFLGELYLLSSWRRFGLLLGGLTLAFCLNVVRTLILTWKASSEGIGAVSKWHDPAGMAIFLISFACLWGIALGLSKQKAENRKQKVEIGTTEEHTVEKAESRKWKVEMGNQGKGEVGRWEMGDGRWKLVEKEESGNLKVEIGTEEDSQTVGVGLRRFLVMVGCWALCVVGFTEIWYRSHEIKDTGTFHWSVNLPKQNPSFQEIELPPRSVKILGHDAGATGKWQADDGSQWTAYFFRWLPRSVQSVIMSRIHRPDRCLPAAGMQQVADSGIKYFAAAGLSLPFRRYEYEADGKTMHVFFCQWEDGSEKQVGLMGSGQSDRLRSVLVGRRRLGNQTLELMLIGYSSLEQADKAFAERLPAIIQLEEPRSTATPPGTSHQP